MNMPRIQALYEMKARVETIRTSNTGIEYSFYRLCEELEKLIDMALRQEL